MVYRTRGSELGLVHWFLSIGSNQTKFQTPLYYITLGEKISICCWSILPTQDIWQWLKPLAQESYDVIVKADALLSGKTVVAETAMCSPKIHLLIFPGTQMARFTSSFDTGCGHVTELHVTCEAMWYAIFSDLAFFFPNWLWKTVEPQMGAWMSD